MLRGGTGTCNPVEFASRGNSFISRRTLSIQAAGGDPVPGLWGAPYITGVTLPAAGRDLGLKQRNEITGRT
jgi:hypothetical protein